MDKSKNNLFKVKPPVWYCEGSELPLDDQKWLYENYSDLDLEGDNSVSVNGNINATCNLDINELEFWENSQAILKLVNCNYKTPPRVVASYLEKFFNHWSSKDGHWLYIAQKWTPRSINSVLKRMQKEVRLGTKTIDNPPAYFTFLIKKRKRRK